MQLEEWKTSIDKNFKPGDYFDENISSVLPCNFGNGYFQCGEPHSYVDGKRSKIMTEYDDVKVIKTNLAGLVVEVKDGRYLVDFGNAKKWFDDCDLLLVEQEDNED